jgi:hypothetical protein
MKMTGASMDGNLSLADAWAISKSLNADQVKYPAKPWVHAMADDVDRPVTATFDYESCGRVLWSAYHTSHTEDGPDKPFPSYCIDPSQPLSPQERVLEFLIFNLSSCLGEIK